MKKILLLVIALLITLNGTNAADSPYDVLQKYYEADKNEDIQTIIDLTDFSSMDDTDAEQFKQQTKESLETLAQIFDTKSYTLTDETVFESGDDCLIFYHLNSMIGDKEGKTASIDLDFVAVMHKTKGEWKIIYIQPKDAFEKNLFLREITISAAKSISAPQPIETKEKNVISKIVEWITKFLKSLFKSGQQNEISSQKSLTTNMSGPKDLSAAYQDYVNAYNHLAELMSQGKGDTPEAQEAYRKYQETKEIYEQIGKSSR